MPHRRGVTRAGLALVGLCLVAASVGCMYPRPRHGVIVRGDCSLEFNRIPWLVGHGPAYPDCGPMPGGAPCHGGAADCMEPCDEGCPGQGKDGLGCVRCGRVRGGKAEQCVNYLHHPRFHPVPTKPAFSPRDCPFPPGAELGLRTPRMLSVPPVADEPRSLEMPDVPKAPLPEEIPAPPGEPESDDRTSAPRRLQKTVPGPSWVFRPPPTRPAPPRATSRTSRSAKKPGASKFRR